MNPGEWTDGEDDERHLMCPICEYVRGKAIATVSVSGTETFTYYCPSCLRTWENAASGRSAEHAHRATT